MKIIFIAFIFTLTTSFIMKSNINKPDSKPVKYNLYYYKVENYYSSDSLATYSITFQDANDNTSQRSSIRSGFMYRWEQTGKRFLYISAQCNKEESSVKVSIYKNGKIIRSNYSYGDYVIADVSGEF